MKYYTYSGKKSQSRLKTNRKKLIINIVIIVAVVALCVAFALLLGNHLRRRLETANLSSEPIESYIEPAVSEKTDPADEMDFVKNDRAEGSMSAVFGYLDLEGCPDEAAAESFVAALKDDGYTGIVFNVRNAAGKYAYASRAASEITRTEASGGVASFEELSRAVYAAAGRGMRSCAYIDLGDVFLSDETSSVRGAVDRAVVKELSGMGFSEIVFDGVTRDHDLTTDFAKRLYEYFSGLRASCPGTDFGVVIDPSVLGDPEKTPALEIVFRYVDFFSLDLSNKETYDAAAVAGMQSKFSGSFGAYSILTLLDGSDIASIRDGYYAFAAAKNPNIAFVTPKTDYEEIKDEGGAALYASKTAPYTLTEPEPAKDTEGADG